MSSLAQALAAGAPEETMSPKDRNTPDPIAPRFMASDEREAYEHGRTQGRLHVARAGLKAILQRAERGRSQALRDIAVQARMALSMSEERGR